MSESWGLDIHKPLSVMGISVSKTTHLANDMHFDLIATGINLGRLKSIFCHGFSFEQASKILKLELNN